MIHSFVSSVLLRSSLMLPHFLLISFFVWHSSSSDFNSAPGFQQLVTQAHMPWATAPRQPTPLFIVTSLFHWHMVFCTNRRNVLRNVALYLMRIFLRRLTIYISSRHSSLARTEPFKTREALCNWQQQKKTEKNIVLIFVMSPNGEKHIRARSKDEDWSWKTKAIRYTKQLRSSSSCFLLVIYDYTFTCAIWRQQAKPRADKHECR